ncbi:hypothetical protein AHAS_Ahas19G0156800 [Arachis hypogaea]
MLHLEGPLEVDDEISRAGKDAYEKLKSLPTPKKLWDGILQRICELSLDWTYNARMAPNRLRANQITKEATTWLYLIFSYVKPKTHFTDITLDVATLLYCILDGKRVDLYKLIHNKMKDTFNSYMLPFFSLVIRLAEVNGIYPDEGELMIETSERAKVIPHGTKFKGEAA